MVKKMKDMGAGDRRRVTGYERGLDAYRNKLLPMGLTKGTDGSFGNENSENSALTAVSKTITPLLKPIGVTDGNWPATVGVFTGIFDKEAVGRQPPCRISPSISG
ncbi:MULTISPECIES: nucleoside recognition domain-containing protein [Desulfococcus]|jgi:hypothetical protein|uniref:Nucleoside recognition domain protein n=1 Tax=Desulfococcus multivorans DSM 2059 TaxID=1121405 RepID=S7V5L9_DESML|nr:nucleoside recognition domain-containing protein [Desulfococcus multivorans]AOY57154.1 putative ferrous iron transport protein, FeoB-like [Desulfococcus multivorans]AQX36449.1 hypothetical protein B2D07_19830 [Desulfococcus multivorans]EPR39908.1 nucleoside recognition domain protein [Desulfococcus multivorans DSM 2059]MDX9819623.1 nucleoside recognition domain-containing protein [Desulfococcus multivorans]SKA22986.1 Nucleoside recognition [Desulfococcus multivorans DSM 2059]